MKKKKDVELTPEQIEQKKKSRFRILILLIVLDIFLVAYLVYEIVTMFLR